MTPRGSAKDRALLLLSVRSRSRMELERRLIQAGFPDQEVAEAIASLEAVGLIEDDRFAREVVRHQAGRRLAGDRAIRSALRQKGVAPEVVESALEEAGDEADRADRLALAKIRPMVRLSPEAASRRLYGLLLRRGFGPGVAREAIRRAISQAYPAERDLQDGLSPE